MTRTDPSNYSTKFVCSGYYLRILISIGKGCEGYVPDLIFPSTTKTLKVAAHIYNMVDGVVEFKLLGYLYKSETKQDNDERLACFSLAILHEPEP